MSARRVGGVEGFMTVRRQAVWAEPAAMGEADGTGLVAVNQVTGLVAFGALGRFIRFT